MCCSSHLKLRRVRQQLFVLPGRTVLPDRRLGPDKDRAALAVVLVAVVEKIEVAVSRVNNDVLRRAMSVVVVGDPSCHLCRLWSLRIETASVYVRGSTVCMCMDT